MQLHYGKIALSIFPALVVLILSYYRRRRPSPPGERPRASQSRQLSRNAFGAEETLQFLKTLELYRNCPTTGTPHRNLVLGQSR